MDHESASREGSHVRLADGLIPVASAWPDREGWAWRFQQVDRANRLAIVPSATPISEDAFELMVKSEVGDRCCYEADFAHPYWPGGSCGITFGIGYDAGYSSSADITADWRPRIEEMVIHRLEGMIGITGERADAALAKLRRRISIVIDWEDAIWVHRYRVTPRIVGMIERSFGNSWRLGPDCLGALASLCWSRGVSFHDEFNGASKMRTIAIHLNRAEFDAVPSVLREMAADLPDGHEQTFRRTAEADLFQRGLSFIQT